MDTIRTFCVSPVTDGMLTEIMRRTNCSLSDAVRYGIALLHNKTCCSQKKRVVK